MYHIQANPSGTRSIEITEKNLQTLEKYSLFLQIADSAGRVDESVLEKLKFTVRSLIASQQEDCRDLLELCLVLYHDNMKSFGLNNLLHLYTEWRSQQSPAVPVEKVEE